MRLSCLLLIVYALFQSNNIKSQEINFDSLRLIVWEKDTKLSWNDFENIDTSKVNTDALAESGILMFGYPQKINNAIEVEVINFFIKNISWNVGKYNKLLIEHEQIHFDISEYYTRLLRSYIANIKITRYIEAKALIDLCVGMCDNAQRLYDLETNHGKNINAQKKWRKKIDEDLLELNKYYKNSYTSEQMNEFERLLLLNYN